MNSLKSRLRFAENHQTCKVAPRSGVLQVARNAIKHYECTVKLCAKLFIRTWESLFQSYQIKLEQQTRFTPQTQQPHTRFTQDSRSGARTKDRYEERVGGNAAYIKETVERQSG